VAELADALASGASDRKVVEVRVLSRAPFIPQVIYFLALVVSVAESATRLRLSYDRTESHFAIAARFASSTRTR
jgi:hypothetical protein